MDYPTRKNQFNQFKTTINGKLQRKISNTLKKTPTCGQEYTFIIKFGGSYNPKEPQTPETLVEQNQKIFSQIIGGKRLKKYLNIDPKEQNLFVNIFYEAQQKKCKKPKACTIIKYFCAKPKETIKIVYEIINQPEPDPFL